MTNILYSFRRCPYAMRARMALHIAGTEYEHREVLLRDKPPELLEQSPKGSVPVFITDGIVIDESIDIMRWALPDAELHTDFIEMIDGPFKHHLDRYKYASRYDPEAKRGDVDLAHRSKAVECLELIENTLNDCPYLHSDLISPTDMAAFPFVRQFAAVERQWWASEPRLKQTQPWLDRCLNSPLFEAVMETHPLWAASA